MSRISSRRRASIVTLSLFCLLLPSTGLAPGVAAAGPFEAFGFHVGRTSFDRTFEEPVNPPGLTTGSVWGWTIGVHADWNLPWPGFILSTELSQVEKGFDHNVDSDDPMAPSTIEIRDKYVSAAFLLTRRLGSGDTRPFLFGGPSLEAVRGIATDREDLRTWSAALQVGVGVHLADMLQARIRYVHDLTESAGSGPGSVLPVKNSGFVITGGLRFSS